MEQRKEGNSESHNGHAQEEAVKSMVDSLTEKVRRGGDGAVEMVADKLSSLGRGLVTSGERVGLFPDSARTWGEKVQIGAEAIRTMGLDGICDDLRGRIRSRPLTSVAIAAAVIMFAPRLLRRS